MKPGTTRRTFLAATATTIPAVALAGPAHADTLPGYAPIPPSAFGPQPNDFGYHVARIKGNLYWVTDSSYQAMVLSTRTGVVLVDAPPTIGRNLLRAINDVTKANGRPGTVTHLVYSHSHADHIGAAGIFGNSVERIAHAETARLLRTDRDPNRPLPTTTFHDRHTLRVGGERLELAHHGPNHTADNIFVHAPDYQTLLVIDVLFPGWVPFKGLAVSQEIQNWVRAHERIMSYPWTTFVGGHLGRLGTRADAALQKNYVDDLAAHARTAIETLDPTPFFQKYGPAGNSWAVFKSYLDEAARLAAAPVIAAYTGKLAGADVFTIDNAHAMVESTRIDLGVLGPFGIHP
ncbi:MBL fold metallo-hydrolase [Actinocrispum sp. NPDC049592]|uniref:MBL fold metallo-hydrolase n=1 Tax=Actinocrispum sp. NPDC049592 TaxID=3154835 RepID=UPI003436457E